MASRTALVIDDNADVREVIGAALALDGFEVTHARNGLDAFERLAQGARPDVIVLDLMMPVMDGWRFIDAVRGFPSLSAIPIVAVSALRPNLEERQRVDAFVPKPFEANELSRIVRSVVRPAVV